MYITQQEPVWMGEFENWMWHFSQQKPDANPTFHLFIYALFASIFHLVLELVLLIKVTLHGFFPFSAPSFISLVCLSLRSTRQTTYLYTFILSGLISQREGKKEKKKRGWLKGHCLKLKGCREQFVYSLPQMNRCAHTHMHTHMSTTVLASIKWMDGWMQ